MPAVEPSRGHRAGTCARIDREISQRVREDDQLQRALADVVAQRFRIRHVEDEELLVAVGRVAQAAERTVDADAGPGSFREPERGSGARLDRRPPATARGRDRPAGRSPPPPVRTKTAAGYPLEGIGARGIVIHRFDCSVRWKIGRPCASFAHPPPETVNGGRAGLVVGHLQRRAVTQ